jgi:membrane protease YdiL (CAAX protease family)
MMASSSASVSELTEIALVVAQLASIAIGLPWYRHLRHGNATRPVNFGGKPVILDETCPYPTVPRDVRRLIVMALLIVVLGIALQLGSSAALSLVEELSPHALQQYAELMESIVGDTLLSFLSVVILAPVSEEIFFRGVTCEMSRRIHPWYWVAIGVQALAFSVAHGNIVQGSYTLVIGLIFGVLCLRIGGLPASILAHAAVNGSAYVVGYMLSPFLAQGVTGLVLACVLAGVLTGLTLYGLLKLVKEPTQPVVS